MFDKVAILGVGLIGGSLGLESKKRKLARLVVGFGRSRRNLSVALKKKLIDRAETELGKAVLGADLILLCAPVASIKKHLLAISRMSAPDFPLPRGERVRERVTASNPGNVLVMDVGSTKKEIVAYAQKVLPKNIHFLGAHPLAGDEKSGAMAARAGLYRGKKCILTPGKGTPLRVIRMATKFWKKMGSDVIVVSPDLHDKWLAATSHLPHMAAFALMAALDSMMPVSLVKQFAGGGLIDTTRIAASDPSMWRDIAQSNAQPLIKSLRAYIRQLTRLESMIQKKNGQGLHRYFTFSAKLRKRL